MKIFKIIIVALIVFSSTHTHAQNRPECKRHREQIKAERVAFITEALSLSEKEAQQFWPTYNDYNSKIEKLRHEKYSSMNKMHAADAQLSDKDYQTFIDKYIYFVEQEANLKKEYQNILSKVLSPKKIYLLYKAERDFKHKLVKGLRGQPACAH